MNLLIAPLVLLASCGSSDGAANEAATANESVRTKATPATQQALPPMPEGLTRLNADDVRKLLVNASVSTFKAMPHDLWGFDDPVPNRVSILSLGGISPYQSSGTYKVSDDGGVCVSDDKGVQIPADCFYLSIGSAKKSYVILRVEGLGNDVPKWRQTKIAIKRRGLN